MNNAPTMSRFLARSGRKLVTQSQSGILTYAQTRTNSSSRKHAPLDLETLLATPTWSVSSLLPSSDTGSDVPDVTPKQLHHLLRLSALAPPKHEQEQAKMLSVLSSQLHFVKDIQKVDTTGVEPLRSLRDETAQGEKAAELGLGALKDALSKEEVRGKYHKRIRRKTNVDQDSTHEKWDVLENASRKVGKYFVVEGGKDR